MKKVELIPPSEFARNYRHGYKTAGKYSVEYAIWMNLRSRCGNPNNIRYDRYGGRGIRVCDRWEKDFMNFLSDMGRRPSSDHSIDRINNDGNYELSNCRWATRKEQCRNRRTSRLICFEGETKTVAEWCEIRGLRQGTVNQRLRYGWDEAAAINTPLKVKKRLVEVNGYERGKNGYDQQDDTERT